MKQSAKPGTVLFREGLGCSFHDNCFSCPLDNPDDCLWYTKDNYRSVYWLVDTDTHRRLVFGEVAA